MDNSYCLTSRLLTQRHSDPRHRWRVSALGFCSSCHKVNSSHSQVVTWSSHHSQLITDLTET